MNFFLLLSLLFINCDNKSTRNVEVYNTSIEYRKPDLKDSLIHRIQHKISKSFIKSIITKNDQSLKDLSQQLDKISKVKKQKLVLYWRCYLQFYSSIFYLEKGDKKMAEKEIDKGIDWLEEMPNKNSEDYALLSMLQGFAIQFKGIKAMFISKKIKKNATTAIVIDSTNLRAYYVYASNDYHTPKKYGGGKEAEKYLLKAISLPSQKIKNDDLPSWGKEESYELLIKFYIRKGNWDLAKKYFQEGIKEFPESYTINQLASKLVGK